MAFVAEDKDLEWRAGIVLWRHARLLRDSWLHLDAFSCKTCATGVRKSLIYKGLLPDGRATNQGGVGSIPASRTIYEGPDHAIWSLFGF
jgi:hypothetical protein